MELVAIFLSFSALIISVVSLYYAHLRRSIVVLEVDRNEGIGSAGSSWRGLIPTDYKILLPLFVVNKGGSTGTLENFEIKIENNTDKIILRAGKLCFEESHRGHRDLPNRLSIKEGEIIPLFVVFSVIIKDIEKINDERVPYVAKLIREIKKGKVTMTYRTRWPVEHYRQDISSDLFYRQIKKSLKGKWDKEINTKNEEAASARKGIDILNKD